MIQRSWEQPRRSRRRDRAISLLFALLAGVLLSAAALIYLQQRDDTVETIPPTAVAGANTLIDVVGALQAEGFEVMARPSAARIDGIQEPGQALVVDEVPVWVFIYLDQSQSGGADRRATVTSALDPASLSLTSPSGQPIAADGLTTVSQSNLFVVVSGEATDEQRDGIERGLRRLA
ncbi:MAG: hypothetical protein WKF80_06770 [Thermomicrobiales bacterium]